MSAVFAQFTTTIHEPWIDYNGHMNDAAYALAVSLANEAFLEHLDLSADYRERTGRTMYTVDLHIAYRAEVHSSDTLAARTHVHVLGARKLGLTTDLVRSDGVVAATAEVLYLHYDQAAAAVVPFDPEQTARLSGWTAETPSGA